MVLNLLPFILFEERKLKLKVENQFDFSLKMYFMAIVEYFTANGSSRSHVGVSGSSFASIGLTCRQIRSSTTHRPLPLVASLIKSWTCDIDMPDKQWPRMLITSSPTFIVPSLQ